MNNQMQDIQKQERQQRIAAIRNLTERLLQLDYLSLLLLNSNAEVLAARQALEKSPEPPQPKKTA